MRSDKKNDKYWKFKNVFEVENELKKQAAETPPPAPETKPNSNQKEPEPSLNLPSAEQIQQPQESEEVKKFKEKYGTADNPK